MKIQKNLRSYIYERDKHRCHFCGKELLFKQVSLDHYLPRSKGGPNEVFNLVLSCKRCNKLKKNIVPQNYEKIFIELFLQAVIDKKINPSETKVSHKELLEKVKMVERLEGINEYIIFQSKNIRFYVQNSKIKKIIQLNGNSYI